jgi:hypothetical protein
MSRARQVRRLARRFSDVTTGWRWVVRTATSVSGGYDDRLTADVVADDFRANGIADVSVRREECNWDSNYGWVGA